VQSTETGDTEEEFKNANDIKYLYFGADGISATYSGGTGVPTMAHEMLRELLNRYVGINYTDEDIINWTALDAARSTANWNCRLQEYKPKSIQHYIDTLQQHGAFIWQEGVDGARVIYIKTSYSGGDVDHEITGDDLDNVKVKLTPMSEVISSTIWRYEKHPATGDYLVEYPKTNDNRANWDFAIDENVATTELEYYDATPTAIATAYDNIYGEPRIVVDAALVNPLLSNIEVGDIVTFSSMPYAPYGYSWSGTYFMITKTLRRIDQVKITAREVG